MEQPLPVVAAEAVPVVLQAVGPEQVVEQQAAESGLQVIGSA